MPIIKTPEEIKQSLNSPIQTLDKAIFQAECASVIAKILFKKMLEINVAEQILEGYMNEKKFHSYVIYNEKSKKLRLEKMAREEPNKIKLLKAIQKLLEQFKILIINEAQPILEDLNKYINRAKEYQAEMQKEFGAAISSIANDPEVLNMMDEFYTKHPEKLSSPVKPETYSALIASISTISIPECDFSELNINESLKAFEALGSGATFIRNECDKLADELEESKELTFKDVVDLFASVADSEQDKKLVKFSRDLMTEDDTDLQQQKLQQMIVSKMGYGEEKLLAKINEYRANTADNLKNVRSCLNGIQKFASKVTNITDKLFGLQKELNSTPTIPSSGIPGNNEPPPGMSP